MNLHFADGEWWVDMTEEEESERTIMAELIDHVELSANQEADIREGGLIWIHDTGTAQDIKLDAKAATLLLDFLLLHQDRLIRHRDAARAQAQEQEQEPTMRLCPHCGQHHYVKAGEFYCPLDPSKA